MWNKKKNWYPRYINGSTLRSELYTKEIIEGTSLVHKEHSQIGFAYESSKISEQRQLINSSQNVFYLKVKVLSESHLVILICHPRRFRSLPLIGNALDILKNNNEFVTFAYKTLMEYGPIATYTLPGFGRFVTVNDPESLEHVMKGNFDCYVKGDILYKILYDFLGDGIFNASGDNWRMQRKLFSHLFNVKNFREIICVVFEEETKKVLAILDKLAESGEPCDLQDLFYRFTLDSFGKITFGLDFKCLTNPDEPVKFAQSFDFVQGELGKRLQNGFWNITELFTKEGRRLPEECKYLTEFSYQIIKDRRNDPETTKKPTDILNLFMNAKYDNGEILTDIQLRDVILNFIIAGRDTTAQALSWMMYNLMVNPSIEEKLVKEVNSLLSDEEQIPNYDTVKQFQYTQATFYETLRLHPVVPNNFRVCLHDDVLPNGTPIYAGELVNWSSWAAGRDERLWGKDAKIFNPERFLNSEDGLKPSQYKFTSFNCGPRLCLGQSFATIEAIMLATAALRKYKFELLPDQKSPPDFKISLTLPMKKPLLVKVNHR
ncbi:cytochrome P450 [Rhizophagus clarus]|uniref:Cytochrome P450 n=1 Tax=Rhizophagus clarus TaxID=94130 RepID=A0A8H3LBA8_9GLOM|nr:cytochrome P450 [Rhizophagus clarus]